MESNLDARAKRCTSVPQVKCMRERCCASALLSPAHFLLSVDRAFSVSKSHQQAVNDSDEARLNAGLYYNLVEIRVNRAIAQQRAAK